MRKTARLVIAITIFLLIISIALFYVLFNNGRCRVSMVSDLPGYKAKLVNKSELCSYLVGFGVFENNGFSYRVPGESRSEPATIDRLIVHLVDLQPSDEDFRIVDNLTDKNVNYSSSREIDGKEGVVNVYVNPSIIQDPTTALDLSYYIVHVLLMSNILAERPYTQEDKDLSQEYRSAILEKGLPFVQFDQL